MLPRSPEADWGLIEAPVDRYAAVVSEGHAARYADESSGSQQTVIMWNPSLGRSAAAAASAAPTHMADLVRSGSARDGDASLPVPVASVRTDLERAGVRP